MLLLLKVISFNSMLFLFSVFFVSFLESDKKAIPVVSTSRDGPPRCVSDDVSQSLNLKIENNFREYTVVIVGIEESQHLFNQLSKIVAEDIIQSFNDTESALEFLRSFHETDIFVIISGTLAHDHAHEFLVIHQIIGVYIYCMDENKHLKWTERIAKIRCVVSNPEQLFIRLHGDIKERSSRWPVGQKSFQKASTSTAQWYHLFLLIISYCSRDIGSSYEEMFDECRAYYKNNAHMLKEIDRFALSYKPENVIYEYTRDSFVYRILNHALRVQDLEIIRKFSPVIRDLHLQLHKHFQDYCRSSERTIRCVYRGQHLSENELGYLCSTSKSRNPIITLTHFGSTSLDREIALRFSTAIPDRIPCLFEIIVTNECYEEETHKDRHQQGFVDISSQSYVPEEQEVLFSLVTHFRVKYVGHSKDYEQYGYVPITFELTRDIQEKCDFSHFDLLSCVEKENDPQVYIDILNMVQMNAADEQQFNNTNWDKWWEKLSRQWGYYKAAKKPLLLILYDCFTRNKFWMRKGVEMHKDDLRSRFRDESTRPPFSKLSREYKHWQRIPTRWIALYEEYLQQSCTTDTKKVVECLRFAGETYELIGDRECALACYQKALDFNVDDQFNKNEQISKRMKMLRKPPKQARKVNSHQRPITAGTESKPSTTVEVEEQQCPIFFDFEAERTDFSFT